jgi:hypothetical protein
MIISVMSVVYAEGLHSTLSAVMLQSTDRHGLLGHKPTAFQESLGQRSPKRARIGPADGAVHKQCASSAAGEGAPSHPPGGLVLGHRRGPAVGAAAWGRHPLYLRTQTRRRAGHDERVFRSSASGDADGVCALGLTPGEAALGGSPAGDGSGLGAGQVGWGSWTRDHGRRR